MLKNSPQTPAKWHESKCVDVYFKLRKLTLNYSMKIRKSIRYCTFPMINWDYRNSWEITDGLLMHTSRAYDGTLLSIKLVKNIHVYGTSDQLETQTNWHFFVNKAHWRLLITGLKAEGTFRVQGKIIQNLSSGWLRVWMESAPFSIRRADFDEVRKVLRSTHIRLQEELPDG